MKGKLYYVIYLVYIFFLLSETWFSLQHQRYTHHQIYSYPVSYTVQMYMFSAGARSIHPFLFINIQGISFLIWFILSASLSSQSDLRVLMMEAQLNNSFIPYYNHKAILRQHRLAPLSLTSSMPHTQIILIHNEIQSFACAYIYGRNAK